MPKVSVRTVFALAVLLGPWAAYSMWSGHEPKARKRVAPETADADGSPKADVDSVDTVRPERAERPEVRRAEPRAAAAAGPKFKHQLPKRATSYIPVPGDAIILRERWEEEDRDEAWASQEQGRVVGHLGTKGIPAGYTVECRTTLCRLGPAIADRSHASGLKGTMDGTFIPESDNPEELEAAVEGRMRLMELGTDMTMDTEVDEEGTTHEVWYLLHGTGAPP